MIPAYGYAALKAKDSLTPFAFKRRDLGANDILIEIQYCGICHTDIHQVNDEWGGMSTYPMVPGHEITGTVAEVGPKTTRYEVGDKVGVGCFVDSCRNCSACSRGLEQYCLKGPTYTYNSLERDGQTQTQGGYSNKIVVNENYVLRMDNLPMDRGAPLLCAGITMYSPLKHWNAGPGKKVGIIGLGGLGHMGVKIAHALGAEVIVVSHSDKKQAEARRMGADRFYAAGSNPKSLKELRGYFDLLINTLSVEINWSRYLNMLSLDGTMVVVGIPEKETMLGAAPLVTARRSLAGSVIGGIQETQEMLDFCGKNRIPSDIELIPIQKVNEAYPRIINSDVRYRFVIDSKTLVQ